MHSFVHENNKTTGEITKKIKLDSNNRVPFAASSLRITRTHTSNYDLLINQLRIIGPDLGRVFVFIGRPMLYDA